MTAEQADRDAPGRSRPRLPRSARRAQLLEAAQEVFVERGYHSAGMDEIADRAGVSKPVLYQHFPGKLELYLALLDQHVEDLGLQVRRALESTTDNKQRVSTTIAAYFDFVDGVGDTSEGAYRLVFESDLRSEPAVRARVEQSMQYCVNAVAETIIADTGVEQAEGELLAVGLVGMAEVASRWWTSTEDPSNRRVAKDRAVELLVSLAWRGLSGSPKKP